MKRAGFFSSRGSWQCVWRSMAIAAEKVTVYTSLETDETVKYLEVARRDMPDLEINIIRLSTGELGARMLAEKDNPQADLVWGWAVTDMEQFVPRGLLVPYKPKGVERLEKRFVHPQFMYVGIDMYIAAFCVNTKVMQEKNLPMPKGWNDLLDPRFKGLVTMPNPVASGTGFLQSPASSRCTARKRARKTAGNS